MRGTYIVLPLNVIVWTYFIYCGIGALRGVAERIAPLSVPQGQTFLYLWWPCIALAMAILGGVLSLTKMSRLLGRILQLAALLALFPFLFVAGGGV
jgi:hypothetical protein